MPGGPGPGVGSAAGTEPQRAKVRVRARPEAEVQPPVVLIRGAEGPDAKFVNGLYDLQGHGYDSTPLYRRRRQQGRFGRSEVDKAGVWLYRAANGTWCVSSAEAKSQRDTACWAFSSAASLGSEGNWQVTVRDDWEQQSLAVVPLSVREATALCHELDERATAWSAGNAGRQVVALPRDALYWSARECDLWFRTNGLFHPRDREGWRRRQELTGRGGAKGRVSVITPTTESRQGFHEKLWACFDAQEWHDKELIVVETYQHQHSSFLAAVAEWDSRLTYVTFELPADADWTIGLKRNICAHLASGEFLVHFDDDDLYSSSYVPTMVGALQGRTVCVKLSTWYIFAKASGTFGFCDPAASGKEQRLRQSVIRQRSYGYGFSYAYRREAVLHSPFEDISFGEDYNFISALQRTNGEDSVLLMPDDVGICLHTQHGDNTSEARCVMQRSVGWEEVCDLDVADLGPAFDAFLRALGGRGEPVEKPSVRPEKPRHRRIRKLTVHLPAGGLQVACPTGATAAEVLVKVEDKIGTLPLSTEVFRIPPPDTVPDEEAEAPLRLALYAMAPGLKPGLLEAGPDGWLNIWHDPYLTHLIMQAKAPIQMSGRVGARTAELWLKMPQSWGGVGGGVWGGTSCFPAGRSSPCVRVTCVEAKQRDSVSNVFHVLLAPHATVQELRQELGSQLPEWAEVRAARPGLGLVVLKGTEHVPDKVLVSDFDGVVTAAMLLTKEQCRKLQHMLLSVVRSPEVQQALDSCEQQANGNEAKFRAKLAHLMLEEVCPDLAAEFGLPRTFSCMRALKDAIGWHMEGDFDMVKSAYDLEAALRNWPAMESNAAALRRMLGQPDDMWQG